VKGLPVFVGVGDRDFGRRGGEALHASLTAAGSTSAVLRIYPDCEHLMVVPDALVDVFAWFDSLLAVK
jgi:acetyl esterase/lipase